MVTRASLGPDHAQDPPRVAYRVRRDVGTAVTRNRLRRRLRGAVQAHGAALEAGTAYLIAPTPAAAGVSSADLESEIGALLRGTPE